MPDPEPQSAVAVADTATRADNVAVVAVHGIGQQKPGDSVRAMAAMLLRLQHADGTPRFSGFVETPLQIPTKPVGVKPRAEDAATEPSRWRESSDALSVMLATKVGATRYAAEYEFMRAQLDAYPGSLEPYATTRIAGARHTPGNAGATTCMHIYEVYWENLSRVGSGPLSLLGAFYQLLFNTANLGQVAVDHAALRYRGLRSWRAFRTLHALATRLFTIFVPAGWMLLLGTSLSLLLLQLPLDHKVSMLGVGAGATTFAALWWGFRRLRFTGWPWLAVSTLTLASAYAASHAVRGLDALNVDRLVVVLWCSIASALVMLLFHRYERVRPGAYTVGGWMSALVLGGTIAWILRAPDQPWLYAHVLEVFAVESALTVSLWYLIYLLGAAAAVVAVVTRRGRSAEDSRTLRQTQWTALATLGTAASAVLVFTFILWSGTLAASRAWLRPLDASYFRLMLPWFHRKDVVDTERVYTYLRDILESSGGAGYPLLLWCMLVTLLTALIAIGPSALLDIVPDERANNASRTEEDDQREATRLDNAADRLGRDLSDRMTQVTLGAIGLFMFAFVVQPTASIAHWWQELTGAGGVSRRALEWLHTNGAAWIVWSGGVLAASGLGLYASRSRLNPMVDTALDVDNYLRQHPRDSTPRARIAERYASLLRYLNAWRDEHGRPYDRVIIVAHSQGSVITADLLGFAKLEREMNNDLFPLLNGPVDGGPDRRLYLFTMGSPLRQIYARTFPLLYEWMRGAHAPWGTSRAHAVGAAAAVPATSTQRVLSRILDGHRVAGPALPGNGAPHPSDFGLWRWVNAYRTGDYVGRAMWRNEATHGDVLYRRAPAVRTPHEADAPNTIWVSEDATGTRRELCIGRGAHTRYWDATAMPVAVELDMLISGVT